MNLGPVVCCAIKGKKEFDVLQRLSVEYTFEGTERPRRIGSFQEDMCSASKDCSFLCAVWLWGKGTTPSLSLKAFHLVGRSTHQSPHPARHVITWNCPPRLGDQPSGEFGAPGARVGARLRANDVAFPKVRASPLPIDRDPVIELAPGLA